MWMSMMAVQGDPYQLKRFATLPHPDERPTHQVLQVSSLANTVSSKGFPEPGNNLPRTNFQEGHPSICTRSSRLQSFASRVGRRIRRLTSSVRRVWRQASRCGGGDAQKSGVAAAANATDRDSKNTAAADGFLAKFSSSTDGWPNEDHGPCTLVFDTSQRYHHWWLIIVSLAVLYNLIFVIGRAVFWELNNAVTNLWMVLDYTCDFIYVIDTIIHMHEGYLEQGMMVRDAAKLRRHYFVSAKWKTDLLSLLPTDLAYFWWPNNMCFIQVPCSVIVRINRLLKIPRMNEFFERTETMIGYPNVLRIFKVVLAILVLIHWNACLYFAISFVIGFGTDNWVYNLNGYKNKTLSRQYIYSFYWSTLTLTTIGETPQPENDAEYLFVVMDFLAGVLIFATIVGNIGSMISNMNVARVEFQNRMDAVKQYMAFRRVGKDIETRVLRWFSYTWANKQALDEDRVLSALPDKLKAEIAIHVHLETLRQVRIFQDCEPGLLEELVLKLRLQVFSPGDYICRKGDVGKEMYIVKRGRLQVVADDGKTVLATLSAGSVFGEVSVLEIAGNRTGNRRTANVRSLGYSDLFCLAKRDLWEALGDYPEARYSLMERGCQLLRKDGLLDEQAFKNSQVANESLTQKVDRLETNLENLQTHFSRLQAEYLSHASKVKQRLARVEKRFWNTSPRPETSPPSSRSLSKHRLGEELRYFSRHRGEKNRHRRDKNNSDEGTSTSERSISPPMRLQRRSFQKTSRLKRHKQNTM